MKNEITAFIFAEHEDLPGVEGEAGKGNHFQVNGWTISAQAGWGNYCDADPQRPFGAPVGELNEKTPRENCEVAIFPADEGGLISLGNDYVSGWVPYGVVFDFVHWLRSLDYEPKEEEVRQKFLSLERNNENAQENR